jgi:hypothetical protein
MFQIITIDELLKKLDGYKHKELHVHHTWLPSKSSFTGNNGIALQEAMKNYHVNTNGWSDIGQHVTLLPNGLFVTGRDFSWTPASILGYNTGGFCCETLGNFDIGNDSLTGEQKTSLLRLGKYFYDKSKYIRFHRENAAKTCPGTSIIKEDYISEIKAFGKAPNPVVVFDGHEYIRQLQELCNENGLRDINGSVLKVDGLWGTKTQSAVPVLYKGCSSKHKWFIKLVQRVLLEKGYKLPLYGADGDFGAETQATMIQFQKDNFIVSDGVIGAITWSKLLG